MPSEEFLPEGCSLGGLAKRGKTAVLPTCLEGNNYEDEWHFQTVRDTHPDQERLWKGYTGFVLSEPVQGYRPSFSRAAEVP